MTGDSSARSRSAMPCRRNLRSGVAIRTTTRPWSRNRPAPQGQPIEPAGAANQSTASRRAFSSRPHGSDQSVALTTRRSYPSRRYRRGSAAKLGVQQVDQLASIFPTDDLPAGELHAEYLLHVHHQAYVPERVPSSMSFAVVSGDFQLVIVEDISETSFNCRVDRSCPRVHREGIVIRGSAQKCWRATFRAGTRARLRTGANH